MITEVLEWACQQQPPCPWWNRLQSCSLCVVPQMSPRMFVYVAQQQSPLPAGLQARAVVSATEMTYALLSLRAALPERTPHEIVLTIVNLAFA